MERGHRRWTDKSDEVLDFLAMPRNSFQRRHFAIESWIESPPSAVQPIIEERGERFPSVAVVTVCLNARNDIEKTIRSVTGQRYPSLEYLILDGGSTDGTVDVIRQYESELAYWTSSPDDGVYPAMQKSLHRVKSEWVLFMNAGDFFLSPNALRRLFETTPETAEVVYGHHIYRHTNEVDELRLASDFRWMWSRLQEGQFDVEYPAGFPAHQATAVRARLLRELEFDPFFRIAADHDLLWRAWRRGAKFFHSDEIVSVYVGGGFSAQQFGRCKQEWCVIALRYSPWKAAPRFRNCTHADAAGAIELDYAYRSERFVKWFGQTTVGRILGFRALAKPAAMLYLRAAKELSLHFFRGFGDHEKSLPKNNRATLTRILPFTRAGLSAFLSDARGLAEPEEWGTWSDGEVVELVFRERLPASFTLVLRACTFGRNARAGILVTVGIVSRQIVMKGRHRRHYRLNFNDHGGDDKMVFSIPYPTAPADLQPLESSDRRRIGLGFVSIRIEPN
jgi:glycosyltransferase involved in cell wall biosynthesis